MEQIAKIRKELKELDITFWADKEELECLRRNLNNIPKLCEVLDYIYKEIFDEMPPTIEQHLEMEEHKAKINQILESKK